MTLLANHASVREPPFLLPPPTPMLAIARKNRHCFEIEEFIISTNYGLKEPSREG